MCVRVHVCVCVHACVRACVCKTLLYICGDRGREVKAERTSVWVCKWCACILLIITVSISVV